MTKTEYQNILNEIPSPADDLQSNGGRIPDNFANRYGDWLRRHDPIAFQVGKQESERNEEFEASQRNRRLHPYFT